MLTCVAMGSVLAAVLVVPVLQGPTDDDMFLAAFTVWLGRWREPFGRCRDYP